MNTPFDRLLFALKLSSACVSDEKKCKDTIKHKIEDLHIEDFHKITMKTIVDNAHTPNEIIENLGSYIMANKLL